MKITYSDKLNDPRWLSKRQEILKRDDGCVFCGSKKSLEVHHVYYVAKRNPWEYPNDSLITVCKKHHDGCHEHGVGNQMNWEKAACSVIQAVAETHKQHRA